MPAPRLSNKSVHKENLFELFKKISKLLNELFF